MIHVLRQRNFALLWAGGLVSWIGNWMLFVALPVYVYRATGSTLATGTMAIAELLPTVLFGSVAGIFVDRWDRKRTLVVTNLILTAALLPLLLVASHRWLWPVYVVGFVESSLSQFLTAETALLPLLVGGEHLVAANSLNSMNRNIARLVGPALGGLLAVAIGLGGVTLIDAASYAFAAAMTALVTVPATPSEPRERLAGAVTQVAGPWKAMWREWVDGLRVVRRDRMIYGIFVVYACSALAEGCLGPLFVAFATAVVHGGPLGYGWLLSAQAVGGIAGSLVVGRFGHAFRPTHLIAIGMTLLGLIDMAIWNIHVIGIDLILMAIVGVPVAGFAAGSTTLLQTQVEDRFRGRLLGTLNTSMAPLMAAGMLTSGALAGIIGIVPMLDVSASFDLAAGAAGFLLLVRRARQPHGVPDAETDPVAPF